MSNVGKKKNQDNMNQKLGLVIKSGKFKLGMLIQFLLKMENINLMIFRLQKRDQADETRPVQAHFDLQQLPRHQKNRARVLRDALKDQGAPLRRKQR